ncbi:MAG: acylhydrolase [Bacteroidales bacterium]|nr:acylhydrolase [Bacteroidales bacterium]
MKTTITTAAIALAIAFGGLTVSAQPKNPKGAPKGPKQEFVRTGEKTRPGDKSKDWAGLACYEEQNVAHLSKPGKYQRPLAVLMGDSITWGWYSMDQDFFTANNLIGRGISGQTTSEMLVRFRPDVIELHPKYAVIMAGTNDLAHNNGDITIDNIFRNIISMAELANAARIKPVLCSIPPASQFGWRPQLGDRSGDIVRLNNMIKEYCKAHRYIYVDYHSAIKDGKNGLKAEFANDAVHPNLKGYKAMEPLLMKVLK